MVDKDLKNTPSDVSFARKTNNISVDNPLDEQELYRQQNIDGGIDTQDDDTISIFKKALGDDGKEYDLEKSEVDFNDDNQLNAFKSLIDEIIGEPLPPDLFETIMVQAVEKVTNFTFENVINAIGNVIRTFGDDDSVSSEEESQPSALPQDDPKKATSGDSIRGIFDELAQMSAGEDKNATKIDLDVAIAFAEELALENDIDPEKNNISSLVRTIAEDNKIEYTEFKTIIFFIEALSGTNINNETSGEKAKISQNDDQSFTIQDTSGQYGDLKINTDTGEFTYQKASEISDNTGGNSDQGDDDDKDNQNPEQQDQ